MDPLKLQHASDSNALRRIQELLDRIENVERYGPSGLFDLGGSTMHAPGHVELTEFYDFHVGEHPATLGRIASVFKALPGLVGYWPMTAQRIDSATDRARDVSGAAYHLVDNNTPTFNVDWYGPYVEFDGSSSFLSRADYGPANWADITGGESHIDSDIQGLTLGGWFYFDGLTGASQTLISKWATSNLSYTLIRDDSRVCTFSITDDGSTIKSVSTGTGTVADLTWQFCVGRFEPSTELALFVSGDWNIVTASIPATVYDGTAPFNIGATNSSSLYLDGRASQCFLCAAYLPDDLVEALFQLTRRIFKV